MECKNHINYDIDKSSSRLDDIINANDINYCDKNYLPSRDKLTFTNGFYVNVTSLFIDIIDSSSLTDSHKRPVLAKIYRSFLSETTAVINSYDICKEISINGDCVWGVFDTIHTSDIDQVISLAAQLLSLIRIMNYKLKKKGYEAISVGIGIDYGRALMVKAGYNGSGLNDVIWMGDVVNQACHLANKAGRNHQKSTLITPTIYTNINDNNKKFFTPCYIDNELMYQGNIVNVNMEKWYKDNCK